MRQRLRQILVSANLRIGYGRDVVHGAAMYGQQHDWLLRVTDAGEKLAAHLAHARYDGLLVGVTRHERVEELQAFSGPILNVSSLDVGYAGPRVAVDDRTVGRLAAEHLIDRGFTAFGFVQAIEPERAQLRRDAFVQRIAEAGHDVSLFVHESGRPDSVSDPFAADDEITQFVAALPRPVGVFCHEDNRALAVANACRALGLRVPEDVAILGCDNDRTICETAFPPLSSIATPGEAIGQRAAEQLDRLMQGRTIEPDIRLPPRGVVQRQSTNVMAIDDADIVTALRFMRDHVAEPITIEHVLEHLPITRRSLERGFARYLQRSPAQELRRLRIERAKQLLAGTDQALDAIAENCGFTNTTHFGAVFRKLTGMTPARHRRQFRRGLAIAPE